MTSGPAQQLSNCHASSMKVHVFGCIVLTGALGSLSFETIRADDQLTLDVTPEY